MAHLTLVDLESRSRPMAKGKKWKTKKKEEAPAKTKAQGRQERLYSSKMKGD